LRGEVTDTLKMLKGNGTRLVLGLRDIVDEPQALKAEWDRKGAIQALEDLYDNIWAYGRPEIYDPLQGLGVSDRVRGKIGYTGYLRRFANNARQPNALAATKIEKPFILVTPGGGGDGLALVDNVLSAYEYDQGIPYPALIISGPFMDVRAQSAFNKRIEQLPNVYSEVFESNMKNLVQAASGVVAMGGYNTFCEILSFDRPSLLVPRTIPRREQYIRASRARDLGLVNMLEPQAATDPRIMAAALSNLPSQQPPSKVMGAGLLDGWSSINESVDRWFPASSAQVVPLRQAESGG
jgi:predicted glycosyltransferase